MIELLEQDSQYILYVQKSKQTKQNKTKLSKLRRAMEDIKKTQIEHLKVNNTVCEMKNILDAINTGYCTRRPSSRHCPKSNTEKKTEKKNNEAFVNC